jgi:ribosomal protein S18 acetylase RimI-like enzyme
MSFDIGIRAGTAGDEQALSAVGKASFLEAFAGVLDGDDILAHCESQHAPAVYSDWLANGAMRIWLAEVSPGRAPIGYLVLAPATLPIAEPRAGDLEIKRIYLLHRFQGQNVGKRLMAAALADARSRGAGRLLLGVYAANHDALAFYRRCGFGQIGQRTFRVGDTDYDDVILAMDLAPN